MKKAKGFQLMIDHVGLNLCCKFVSRQKERIEDANNPWLSRVVLETERISTRDRVKERESMRESQEREEREIECGREKYDNREVYYMKRVQG